MANISLGTLLLKLAADSKQWDKGFRDAEKSSDKFGKGMGDLSKLAKTALAGGVAGAAAVAAAKIAQFSQESLEEFKQFEKGMSEIFSLMPGMSEKAMGEMEADILKLGSETGRLSSETIPALYAAISAGVPDSNVFEFLQTSSDLAAAGVVSMGQAVDSISTVVNAYGESVISATEASDLMFTAVKGGKTTVGELSGTLSNVIPIAASLGVEFGQVTAALASMTAQGIPTAQATTQLRQLMVELSKAGGKTDRTFRDVSGKSFKDFIAQGGNVQEALQLLEGHASDLNIGVNDLFGSVEAGNAALALTGAGTQKFTDELKNAENAAGATAEAAKTLTNNLDFTEKQIAATMAELKTLVGEGLEPTALSFAELKLNMLETVTGTVRNYRALSRLEEQLRNVADEGENAGFVIDRIRSSFVYVADETEQYEKRAAAMEYATARLADGFEGSAEELADLAVAYADSNQEAISYTKTIARIYTSSVELAAVTERSAETIREDAQARAEAAGANEELADKIAQTRTAVESANNANAAYFASLNDVRAAEEAAAQAAAAHATVLGGYFDSALTATEQTTSLEMQLYNSAAAAGVGADQLVILAAATGEFSQEEIEAAFQTALMQANIDTLVGAMQDGSITADEATAALGRLQAGEVDTAADAIALAQKAGAVQSELDGVSGAAIDAAGALDRIPREINVRVKVQADPVPTYRSSDPNSPGGGATAYAEGGFTGGREGEIVGAVHGQEYVFSAPSVRNIGLGNLEALDNLGSNSLIKTFFDQTTNNNQQFNLTYNGAPPPADQDFAVLQAMIGGT